MTLDLQFTKGHGTGNDFVLFSDPNGDIDLSEDQIRVLCDRNFGIGADGTIRAIRSANHPLGRELLEINPKAEWFMDYINSDGSEAKMCGNGIRVFFRYLIEEGLLGRGIGDGAEVFIGTRAGVRTLRAHRNGFEVDLGEWSVTESETVVHAQGLGMPRTGLSVDVGNPHLVVVLAELEELDSIKLEEEPRCDPEIDGGVNVEFVVPRESREVGVGSILMRVHERGAGETLSCGTGAAASALAARHWAGKGAPEEWVVTVAGGELGVRITEHDGVASVSLSGPAVLVYDGVIRLS